MKFEWSPPAWIVEPSLLSVRGSIGFFRASGLSAAEPLLIKSAPEGIARGAPLVLLLRFGPPPPGAATSTPGGRRVCRTGLVCLSGGSNLLVFRPVAWPSKYFFVI